MIGIARWMSWKPWIARDEVVLEVVLDDEQALTKIPRSCLLNRVSQVGKIGFR